MALDYAILVSLAEQPSSGYELARRFDKSIGLFWTATHQQIYKVLARMEAAGWVHADAVPQDGRPTKKVYALTAEGRGQLRRWLAQPAQPEATRSELAVKLRGAAEGDAPRIQAELLRHRDLHAARLADYRAVERREFPRPDQLQGRPLHQYLVLRGGIRYERSARDWCAEALAALAPDPKGRA